MDAGSGPIPPPGSDLVRPSPPDGVPPPDAAHSSLPMAWLGRLIGRGSLLLYPLVGLAIAILGWTKLEQPFGRDQLIHHWVALRLVEGAALYRDAWDVKPPALYLFHAAAIRFIEATPRGVHLVELIWQLAFAIVLMLALRPYYRQRWLAALAPLVCLAPYYAYVRPYAQTQAEILACLPLFIAAWMALAAATATGRRRLAGALACGVAAGVVTAFKHVLAPLPLAFLIVALIFAPDRRAGAAGRGRTAAIAAALAMPFAAGVALVWAVLFAWIEASGGGDVFLWTLFAWPLDILTAADPAPLARLGESMAVFLAMLAPCLVLLLVAAPAALRSGEASWTAMLWVWLIVGLGIILLQQISWFTYHFLLLFPPVGLLALRAIDRLVENLAGRSGMTMAEQRGLAAAAVAVILAGLAYPVGETARTLYQAFVVDRLDGDGYRRKVFPEYARPAEVADYLRRYGRPGAVYAVESLAVPVLAGRPIDQPVPGQWLVLLPLAERWQQMPEDLARCPPVYFFVETAIAPLFARRYPALPGMLAAGYHPVFASTYGRLYERRFPATQEAGEAACAGSVDNPAGTVN